MLKTSQAYNDKTSDYEEMSVARNAPRWIKMMRKHGFMPSAATATA